MKTSPASPDKEIEEIQYRDMSRKIHDMAGDTRRLIKAQIELTYRCNLHCVHCYTDPYNSKEYFPREMNTPEILHLLDQMAEIGILWLNFTGGEAMARKDFFEIYEYAHKKGFIISVFSNGTVFTEKMIERLKQNPPFSIDISCHSVNEDAFDRFTQVPGSFQKFMQSIRLLQQSGLPYFLKTKAMTWNKTEMPAIRKFYESLGFEFDFTTSLTPRLNRDTSSLQYRLPPDEIAKLETAEKIWADDPDSCQASREFLNKPESRSLYRCACLSGNSIHVNAWGELGTCTLEYQVRIPLKKYPLKEAVEKLFAEIRGLHYNSASPCSACQIFAFCDKSPTALEWETGSRENPAAWYCDTATDRAKRLTGLPAQHPLNERKN